MEYSGHLHPEFGLFSPTARLRREMRIAATAVLIGGIAGALCVSRVIGPRHSDGAAMEFAEGSGARGSKEGELVTGPSMDGRGATPEGHAPTTAPNASAGESPLTGSGETSAEAGPHASDVAPKARTVRIRRTVESPAIARVPLGRIQAPATASLGDAPESTQASNAAQAGNGVPAAAPEKAGVRPGTSDRTDDSTRAAVPASPDVRGATPEKAGTRTGAREGLVHSSPPKNALKTFFRNASSRRKDTGNDPFWRDDRQDDWRGRAATVNDGRSASGRAYAREATSSFGGFWDWSR